MKLLILGQWFTVTQKQIEDGTLAGRCNMNEGTIEVCDSLEEWSATQTLVHEIVHAAMHRVGIAQTSIHHDLHEVICEAVAHAIAENFQLKERKVKGPQYVTPAKGKAKTRTSRN